MGIVTITRVDVKLVARGRCNGKWLLASGCYYWAVKEPRVSPGSIIFSAGADAVFLNTVSSGIFYVMQNEPRLRSCAVAECVGTFILIFFGCGAVHVAVSLGGLTGGWQVASVWGFAVTLAIYAVGNISGAHINPAITVAMTCWGGFPRARVPAYIAAQLAGAFLAACCLYVIFAGSIAEYEKQNGITRGKPESVVTAAMYGEYHPNPTVKLHAAAASEGIDTVGTGAAVFAEVLGTALLAFCVFAFTDRRNKGSPGGRLAPFFIGATVTLLVVVLGPVTQACLNPARDFGPRIFAALAGWGEIALPGPRGLVDTLAVYLAAPIAGGVLGGLAYQRLIGDSQPDESAEA